MDVKKVKKKSQKQEQKVAKQLGGKAQIGSGCLDGMKGDVRTGDAKPGLNDKNFLVECKYSDSGRYPLNIDTWEKINKEALRDGLRIPLMQIDLYDLANYNSMSLVVIHFADFLALEGDCHFIFRENVEVTGKSIQLNLNKLSAMRESFHDKILRVDLDFQKYDVDLVVMEFLEFKNFLDNETFNIL